ncbi:hypothetical protein E4K72_07510 [Oxalobacteraceae bacterium OM1]|nr:hypothetical protein E4K72_07510 [Oxalobacteraceae bacterium OM1]
MMSSLFAWLFIGVLDVERMEDEGYYEFFMKKHPTTRVVFSDPYASDAVGEESENKKRQDANGDWTLGTLEMDEYLEYCKYRFGIEKTNSISSRDLCKKQSAVQ